MTESARYVTPPALAALWGCKPDKVLGFIRRGDLRAFDISQHPGVGRPRWRISTEAIEEFERRRAAVKPAKTRKQRKGKSEVLDIIR